MIEDMKKYQKEYHKTYQVEWRSRPEVKERNRLRAAKKYAESRERYFQLWGIVSPRRPDYTKESLCRKCNKIFPKGIHCPDCNTKMRNKQVKKKYIGVHRY